MAFTKASLRGHLDKLPWDGIPVKITLPKNMTYKAKLGHVLFLTK